MAEPARTATVTREISLDGAAYCRFTGTACPDCGSPDVEFRNTRGWDHSTTPPTRTRYHRCRSCDRRFKSVEVA